MNSAGKDGATMKQTSCSLESDRRYLEFMPCGVLIVESGGAISFANHASSQILGYSKDELEKLSFYSLILGQILGGPGDLRASCSRPPVTRSMSEGGDLRAIRKDGQSVPVEIGLTSLSNGQNKPRVICCINDISERKSLEKQLQTYTGELERSNNELNTFAYTVSHDLKEPLRGILTLVEFLREDCQEQLDDQAIRYLKRIEEQGAQMGDLIDTVLNYSKLGQGDIHFVPVDISLVLEQSLARLSVLMNEKNVTCTISSPLPAANGDQTLLTEVFFNQICNAIQHNDSEHKTIEIYYDAANEAYVVKDNGPGISPEEQDLVFQMFYRSPTQKSQKPGSGIGMAIIEKVVTLHRGCVWIESGPEGGTKVFTYLPKAAPANAD